MKPQKKMQKSSKEGIEMWWMDLKRATPNTWIIEKELLKKISIRIFVIVLKHVICS